MSISGLITAKPLSRALEEVPPEAEACTDLGHAGDCSCDTRIFKADQRVTAPVTTVAVMIAAMAA